MRIIASDSGAAILDERFEAEEIVAVSAVLVEPPYTQAAKVLSTPVFEDVSSKDFVLKELKLSKRLLQLERADVIHLDMTLGGVSVLELTYQRLDEMRISRLAKDNIREQLPHLRKVAEEIKRTYGIDVLAIGKRSIPIRIAELTIAAHALIYCSERVLDENTSLVLGLPTACTVKKAARGVIATSLISVEEGLLGFAQDGKAVVPKVNMREMMNPNLREFRMIQISPK